MTQIYETDAAMVRLLQSCMLDGVDVASGPHEWDGSYVQKLLSSAPAVRVCFIEAGRDPAERSTTLNMDGRWVVLVVNGWQGGTDEQRRLGDGAGLDLTHRVAAVIHNAILEDSANARLPIPAVDRIEVLASGEMDAVGLWVAAITVTVELPLDLPEDCEGALDDWLRMRGGFDIAEGKPRPATAEDAYTDADVPVGHDFPSP